MIKRVLPALLISLLLLTGKSVAQSDSDTRRGLDKTYPFGTAVGYETKYGGMTYAGLYYFKPLSTAEWEVRWYRIQADYGWNNRYKSVNLTWIYNYFLIFGGGLNGNVLIDNEGSRNYALQPLIDVDLVYLTLILGYNINLNRDINLDNKFNFRVQVDILALIDAIRAKP